MPPYILDEVRSDFAYETTIVNASNALFEVLSDGRDRYLVVDGLDLIDDEQVKLSLLQFCQYAPPWFHVIILANSLSKRFESEAGILGHAQIEATDLVLRPEEARRFITQSLSADCLEDEWFDEAYRITEGWVQGVAFAAQTAASEHYDRSNRFDGLNRHVRRYFEGYVRPRLPGELVSFLCELSLFERFSRSLCEAAFAHSNTQGLIDEVLRRSLYVVPCDEDGNWYRFNNLFVDWLRDEALQLRTESVRRNCFRASIWFHEHGYANEAAKYLLLASDFPYLENLTEATCGLTREDKKTPYLLWLCRMPASAFDKTPLLCMLSAWSYITNARVANAREWLSCFEQSIQANRSELSLDPHVADFALVCVEMKCAAMAGVGDEVIEQCHNLIMGEVEIKPSLRSMIYQSLGEAYERTGELAKAQESYLQAQASADVDSTAHQRLFNAASYAEVQYYFGELSEVQESCETLLRTCPADLPLYGFICALLGRVLIEHNECERVSALVQRALKMTSHYYHIDMYLEAKMTQAQYLLASGKLPQAYEAVVEGMLHGERGDVPRGALLSVYFLQAQIAARRENIQDLQVIERKLAKGCDAHDTHRRAMHAFVQALVCQVWGHHHEALMFYDEAIELSTGGNLVYIIIRALIQKALLFKESDDAASVKSMLERVLALASRYGFVRAVIDAGDGMREILSDYTSSAKGSNALQVCAKALLVAFGKNQASEARETLDIEKVIGMGISPLTPREREVLRLMNMGLSRHEISDVLCISINTVKKHIANIYDKLGVNSRKDALAKAPE